MQVNIDGDILLYRCAWTLQKKVYVLVDEQNIPIINFKFPYKKDAVRYIEDDTYFKLVDEYRMGSPNQVKPTFDKYIGDIKTLCGTDNVTIFLNGPTNFRDELATIRPYKGGRGEKPKLFNRVRSHIMNNYHTVISVDNETDDMLALHQTNNSILWSIDKDLEMVEGLHCNFKEVYEITPLQAIQSFYCQLVTGDPSVDNIPGSSGYGKTHTQDKIKRLDNEVDMLEVVIERYRDPKRWKRVDTVPEDIEEIGHLLWMQRPDRLTWLTPQLKEVLYER